MPTDTSQQPIREGLLQPGPEITEYGLYCRNRTGDEYWLPCRGRVEQQSLADYWSTLGWTCAPVTRTYRKPAWKGLT
jgi:hypothetical protein